MLNSIGVMQATAVHHFDNEYFHGVRTQAMNEKGSRYALSALKRKRASLAAEIVQLESKLKARRDSLGHVDACLMLLDPSCAVEDIPNKRLPKRVKLFRQGELGRLILGALRQSDGKPLSTAQIVDAVLAAGGHGKDARPALRMRVRGNLGYLERRGKVTKLGARASARWTLAT